MALPAGTCLGPYEILAQLGAGGMGEVFEARGTRLGRDVAIKVLPAHLSANAEIHARFEREARAISQLNHPHICSLHDIDYLVMEYLEGETLAARVGGRPAAFGGGASISSSKRNPASSSSTRSSRATSGIVIEYVPMAVEEDLSPVAPRQLEFDTSGYVQMELQGLEAREDE